ncbi:hypothetical protein [Pseudophaeobacter sp.]|uniref:hypothetical protein n=1 Tax=Pseudophaeobacter sp. TaxID=1971739 RepID=UPI004058373A
MKTQKRAQLHNKCRFLWEEFDPIGVLSSLGDVSGEYDSYVAPTVDLVVASADRYKFSKFVQSCVYANMGLARSSKWDGEIEKFADKLCELTAE